MNNLAWTYQTQGKSAAAAALQGQVLEKRKHILSDAHPDTLGTMHSLALTYQAQGKIATAAGLQEQVLEKRKHILSNDHPDTLASMNDLTLMQQLLRAEHPDNTEGSRDHPI